MQRHHTQRQFRIARGANFAGLLDAIHPGPPSFASEGFFHDDLAAFGSAQLRDELRRLQLRVLLTDSVERDHWPTTWIRERIARIEEHLHVPAR